LNKNISFSKEESEIFEKIFEKVETKINANENINKFTLDEFENFINDTISDKNDIKIQEDLNLLKVKRNERLLNYENKIKISKLEEEHLNAKIIDNTTGKSYTLAELLRQENKVINEPTQFKINSLNDKLKTSKTHSIITGYQKNNMKADLIRVLSHFRNDESFPIFVKSIEINDISNYQSKIDNVKIKFNILNKRPQTLEFNLPKMSSDGFIFLNGSRKKITNQVIPFPIAKVKYDGDVNIRISTNYNRIFLMRQKFRSSPFIDSLANLEKEIKLKKELVPGIIFGNASLSNDDFISSYLFDELSKTLIEVSNSTTFVTFKRENNYWYNRHKSLITELDLEKAKSYLKEENEKDLSIFKYIIGYHNNNILLCDEKSKIHFYSNLTNKITKSKKSDFSKAYENDETEADLNFLVKFILNSNLEKTNYSTFNEYEMYAFNKKYVYSKVKVLGEPLSLAFFLSYKIGISKLLELIEAKFLFVSNEDLSSKNIPVSYNGRIKFKNGILYFETNDLSKNLIINGLAQLETSDYNFDEFEKEGKPFNDYFTDIGKPKAGKGLFNFYVSFIDPITANVLKESSIPTDIESLFIYANKLLEDNNYIKKNNMNGYRIRNAEFINAITYKVLASSIERYKRLGSTSTNASFTIPPNEILKEIVLSPITKDAPLLNPIKEVSMMVSTTYKGEGGSPLNSARGTEELRSYDNSMLGIYGQVVPYDMNAGITRFLTYNASIESLSGKFEVKGENSDDVEKMSATDLFSVGELLANYSARHSDPPRMAMGHTQAGHTLPTVNMTKALVYTGANKIVPHFCSNEFSFKAHEDGVISKIDNKNKLIELKYNDGTFGYIDTKERYIRSESGFYVNIALELNSKFKEGSKFLKGDILAVDENSFSNEGNDSELLDGTLAKVALATLDNTYEDSCVMTKEFSEKCSSYITMVSELTLDKNANLLSIVKVGDQIKSTEPLAVFEEVLEASQDLSKLLANMSDEFNKTLEKSGKTSKVSKYTGEIVDIRVHYTEDLNEYSASLKKYISSYIGENKSRQEKFKNVRSDQFINSNNIDRNLEGKAGSTFFEGILIEFFIKVKEDIVVGDKTSLNVALKTIITEILPVGKEPISEYRPENKVDYILSPMSVVSRMTMDFYLNLFLNKVMKELIFQVKDDI
jgi:hypothetical protein